MLHQTLSYEVDGRALISDLYRSGTGACPGILLFPDIRGLRPWLRDQAAGLAAQGYAVLACDLHGGGAMLSDGDAIAGRLAEFRQEPGTMERLARASLNIFADHVRCTALGALGYCIGGTIALEMARQDDSGRECVV